MTFSNFSQAVQYAEQVTTNRTYIIGDNTSELLSIYEALLRFGKVKRYAYNLTYKVTPSGVYYTVEPNGKDLGL